MKSHGTEGGELFPIVQKFQKGGAGKIGGIDEEKICFKSEKRNEKSWHLSERI